MNILGISCYYHDAAAALLQDGMLIAAAAEERFSRVKHDSDFPRLAINFCLEQAGITAADLDYVVFYEKPFRKFDRILQSSLSGFPRSLSLFRESMLTWFSSKLWIKGRILDELNIVPERLLFSEHHLSHAASAFFASPFDEAAILTVDGVGEWATATTGIGRGAEIHIDHELRWPHSLGMLYSTFTAFLGFEVNEGEYKVMGMAPYGIPRYVDNIWQLVHVSDDGAIELDLDYFAFHYSHKRAFSKKFLSFFGEQRAPNSHFFTQVTGYPSCFGRRPSDFDAQAVRNQEYADIAASVQVVTEEVLLKMVNGLCQRTGLRKLCIAGGVGLNSVANGRMLSETPVEELFVQPAAGDDGGALGAALYAWHCVLGKPRAFTMNHAYWGRAYSEAEIAADLAGSNCSAELLKDEASLIERATADLLSGKVIGWYQGRFEWGPRALGNRSILADPRREAMKDVVNTRIKFREPFRPFAPSVLAERAGDYFDSRIVSQPAARFMLCVSKVNDARREQVPAVVHVDGSARPQIVERDENPRYHRLIESFEESTGVPVLLNTSFNLRGEPIISTPAEALSTFARSDMDALYMDRYVVRKS